MNALEAKYHFPLVFSVHPRTRKRLEAGRIPQAVEMTAAQFKTYGPCRLPDDYNVPQVSWKVARIILSYTDYINRRVWFKGERLKAER